MPVFILGAPPLHRAAARQKGTTTMTAGRDLTRQIIGKRIRIQGPTSVEGIVNAVSFEEYGIRLSFAPAVAPFDISVTITDDTEVTVAE